jgi:hypothetical protein
VREREREETFLTHTRARARTHTHTHTRTQETFLTFRSGGGLVFGIANVVGNFGTVFADQSYWQGAIACKPDATWKGYLLGGLAWFAIPFCMATTFGLAGRALDLPITLSEAGHGLVPPAVGVHLMGKGGAFLIALQLFMAVTSTANSEQLAVSSLIAYDVYKRYMNPSASGKQVIFVSRLTIAFWALFSGIIACILKALGIGLGWVYMMMGCCIGCAVLPITFALCWKDCTATGAICGAWGGMISAFIGWFAFAAAANGGVISVATLGQDYPQVTGNLLSLCVSPLLAVGISRAQGGQNFDWAILENATSGFMVEHDKNAVLAATGGKNSKEAMDRAMYLTLRIGFTFSLILIPIWPLLALPQDPFSRSYFTFYVALSFIWGHLAMCITTFIPIYEFLYPDPEDEDEAPRGEGAEAKRSVDAPEQGVPTQQVTGFVMDMGTLIYEFFSKNPGDGSEDAAPHRELKSIPTSRERARERETENETEQAQGAEAKLSVDAPAPGAPMLEEVASCRGPGHDEELEREAAGETERETERESEKDTQSLLGTKIPV